MSPTPSSQPVVTCAKCEAEHDANREFCTTCGAPLWEACIACGTKVSSAERFCGNCGKNIAELLDAKEAEIRAGVAEASEHERKHRFDEACRVLRGITVVNHSRFADQFRAIEESIERLSEQHRIHQDAFDVGLDRIRAMIKNHAYKDAITQIERLPESLREGEAVELLETATKKYGQVKTLKAEVKQKIAAKEFLELAPLIKQIKELDPENKQIESLSQQVAERVQRKVEKLLARKQYDRVLQLIDAVPAGHSSSQLEAMFDVAREVDWLRQAIRFTPYVNETLQAIAERLVETVPDNENAAEHLAKIQERVAQKAADSGAPSKPWATPPGRAAVGVPADFMGADRAIKPQDGSANRSLRQHPGRFHPAIGLALQGLGHATVNVNLWVPEKRSVLDRLSSNRKPVGTAAWGLDLGDSALKFVKLLSPGKDEPPIVATSGLLRHPQPLCQTLKRDEADQIIRNALAKFLETNTIAKGDIVAVNMPAGRTLPRLLMLPDSPPKKLMALLTHEIPHQIPVPLEDLTWGHEVMGTNGSGLRAAAFLAARTSDARARLRPFEEAEISVSILQSDAAALHNYVSFALLDSIEETDAIATLDIGSETSSLVISSADCVWFRSLRLGGNDFTNSIVKHFQLTLAQAEVVKREPQRSKTFKTLFDCLDPVSERLVNETQRSLESYRQEVNKNVARLYLTGGGSTTFGLLRRFWFGR